jgi:hypothetical protein
VLSTPGGSGNGGSSAFGYPSDIYTAGMCNASITATYGGIIHAFLRADGGCFYEERDVVVSPQLDQIL